MTLRPLFIALRSEWFDAFRDGSKRIEWRVYGARWNSESCPPGRVVTLSRGYSGARIMASIAKCERVDASGAPAEARAIFPDATHFCAIHLEVAAG